MLHEKATYLKNVEIAHDLDLRNPLQLDIDSDLLYLAK